MLFGTNAYASMAALLACLAAAVACDLRMRRVPNQLVLVGIAAALLLHLAGPARLAGPQAWAPLAGLLAGGLLLMPLYLLRACGAGDVKLMAMAGAYLGPAGAASAVVCTLIAGGALSLVFMLGRGVAARTLANLQFMVANWARRARTGHGIRIEPLAQTAARLPYAAAIALGTLAALALR